jgi:hypothetical protein
MLVFMIFRINSDYLFKLHKPVDVCNGEVLSLTYVMNIEHFIKSADVQFTVYSLQCRTFDSLVF